MTIPRLFVKMCQNFVSIQRWEMFCYSDIAHNYNVRILFWQVPGSIAYLVKSGAM
jgi:hypothetical protein